MKKNLIPALLALVISSIASTSVFAAAEGETFNLKVKEKIIFGSDAQIWHPDIKPNGPAKNGGHAKKQPLKAGAIVKDLGPGTYKCNAETFGGDPHAGKQKFCKGWDDIAKNSK